MTFIEQLLGLAPDGGNGSTEALIFFGVTAIVVLVAWRRRASRRRERVRH